MTPSTHERRVRALLPVLRLLQVYMPLSLTRWSEKRSAASVRVPADLTHEVISADGVRCEWFIPQNSPEDRVLLYLHGGGFVYGISFLHRQMIAYLARKLGMRVLLVDYRTAPEHPFPAALDDCVAAYRWLVTQGVAAPHIVMAGDSAGANLTLTTLMSLRDSGDPLPAAAACLSPLADMTDRGRHSQTFRDPLLHPKASKFYNESYVAQSDPRQPLISPVFGDWRGLPPLLVHAGENEVLRGDAVRVEELARQAGVDVRLKIYPRMWHVWQLYLSVPQAIDSLDEIAAFLTAHMGISTPTPR